MNDLSDVRKQLSEAQAKEVKQIDKKKFDKMNRFAQTENDRNMMFILDNMARFLDQNEKSSYSSCRNTHFATHEAFTD